MALTSEEANALDRLGHCQDFDTLTLNRLEEFALLLQKQQREVDRRIRIAKRKREQLVGVK